MFQPLEVGTQVRSFCVEKGLFRNPMVFVGSGISVVFEESSSVTAQSETGEAGESGF